MNAAARHTPTNCRAARRSLRLCCALLAPLTLAVLLAPPSAAQTGASAAAGEHAKGGAITGRVVGEDGQPLSNVRVVASRTVGAPGFAASAQSDEEGKFTLSNLGFGAYLVNAFAPGYQLEPDPFDQSVARIYQRVGDSVRLRLIKGGVITGTVTDAVGEPVVGVFVDATRVRHADGRVLREGASGRIWQARRTDDRGVYRIYGLRPGSYIVRAGGRGSFAPFTPYDLNAPTYYPSATRDVATEVSVQAGQETGGIDIRYRGEAGRTISGTVSGALPPGFSPSGGILIALKHVSAAAPELLSSLSPGNTGFAFEGVAEGDYDLLARTASTREDFAAASPPQRVSVRGRDITGIALALAPLGSVSGQLLFDPAAPPEDKHACRPARAPRAEEAVVGVRRDDSGNASDQGVAFFSGTNETAPGDKGEFQLRNLKAGRYQLFVRLPAADFYVRTIALANAPAKNATPAAPVKSAAPAQQAAGDPARAGFGLQTGERLSGLNIHVAAGAAGLRGRVAVAADGAGASPARVSAWRVHLVPAERELADNILRYAESGVAADGAFAFANLAPGRYWLLARASAAQDLPDNAARPLAWDASARARLRREAETANALIALAPCRRVNDFVLPTLAR